MPHSQLTSEEVARRAKELYEEEIRAQVEPGNSGKYLVIDINTGEYEMGDDYMILVGRLNARHPDAALFTMRIGCPAAARIGSKFARQR
jgi:hypothetical protein